jgi:hypothetical protein
MNLKEGCRSKIIAEKAPGTDSGQKDFEKMPETNGHSQVMTLRQTAEYLRISKAHLSNVINGKVAGVPPLRHFRAGRRILIKRNWADEWLETAAQQSADQW